MKKTNKYGSFANLIFEPFSSLIAKMFPSLYKNLTKNLTFAGREILTTTYLSSMFLTSFLVFFISAAIAIVLLYQYSIWYGVIIAIILSGITKIIFLIHPKIKAGARRRVIDDEFPFIVGQLSSLASTGLSKINLFKPMQKYKEAKIESLRVINYVNFKKRSLQDSIIETANNTPSKKFKEFLLELSKVINNKSQTTSFLNKKARDLTTHYQMTRKVKRNLFRETGNIFHGLKFKFLYAVFIFIALLFIAGMFYLMFNFITYEAPVHFYIFLIIGVAIAWIPVAFDMHKTFKDARQKENEFFQFVKDLKKHKLPMLKEKNYGSITPNIKKLIHQYQMNIPLNRAFKTFAKETKTYSIKTIIAMSTEAEKVNKNLLKTIDLVTRTYILRNKLKFEK